MPSRPDAHHSPAVAAARAALDAHDAAEAEDIRRWALFGEGDPPPIKHAARARLAHALAEAQRAERGGAALSA